MHILVDIAGERRELAAREGQSVLDVLQNAGIEINAPCGGAGTCGKCQVMVRGEDGLSYRLACEVPAEDGLEVVVERVAAMEVIESGIAEVFPPTAGASGLGVAVDVGTTTLAAHLHDLATGERLASVSRANPQSSFGADVISRITASVEGKLSPMTEVVQDALLEMEEQLCKAAGVSAEGVVKRTLTGNTVMQHIACGLPPDSIGVSPFTPLSLFGDMRDLGKGNSYYFMRCIASYVGGDLTAGMLACGLDRAGTALLMDLGTNGEMALHHEGNIYACATAAGPVFEGANIHFGMPALPGAIAKVGLSKQSPDPAIETRVLGDVEPIGICGTGIVDAVALMVELGVVEESGYLQSLDEASEDLRHFLGEEEGTHVFYLTPDKTVYITQADVRNVQLAKAAVCAGVRTLVHRAGISINDLEKLYVAGGFGAVISMKSAARIGLFPRELENRAQSIGNSSAEGAAALLISEEAARREEEIADKCVYVELSTSPEFNEFYIDEMEFSE